jgi:transcription initiation factor IIE alpha subunit
MTRVTPIIKSLNLETLEDRTKGKVIIIQKALNHNLGIEPKQNLLQCSDKHRDKNTFFIPYARTNAYKYSFFPSGIRA